MPTAEALLSPAKSGSADSRDSARLFRLGLLAVCCLSALLLSLFRLDLIGSGELHGPDDYLRLEQVRDFLAGQSWFDVRQYRLNAPDGAPMHWSRLVDLPLALVIALAAPVTGMPMAERLAAIIVPLVTLSCVTVLSAVLIRRAADWRLALIGSLLIPTMMFPAIQLSPMRIDHHGWQLALGLTAAVAICGTQSRRSAMVGGLALALMLHISLEGLPLAVTVGALLALRALFDRAETGRLLAFITALTIGSAGFFVITQPVAEWKAAWCDAIMPAYLAAFAASTLILGALQLRSAKTLPLRIAIGVAAGVAAYAAVAAVNPACLAGPFATLDPLVRDNWYVNVREGMPLWHIADRVSFINAAALGVGLVSTAVMLAKGGWHARFRVDISFLFIAAAIAGAFVLRSIALAQLLSLPALLYAFAKLYPRARKLRTGLRLIASAGLLLFLLPSTPILAASLAERLSLLAGQKQTAEPATDSKCFKAQAWQPVARLPATDMLTPLDPTPTMIAGTPHRMLASGHHRNDAMMRAVISTFHGSPDNAYRLVKTRGLTHVAWCNGAKEMQFYARAAPDGFAARLESGDIPRWLQPVLDGKGSEPDKGVRLYRVTR